MTAHPATEDESTQSGSDERRMAIESRIRVAEYTAAVGRAITEAEHTAEMMEGCAEALVTHLGAAFGRIWTVDASGAYLELQASAGLYTHRDGPHGRIRIGEFKIGGIALDRAAHLTNDVPNDPAVSDPEWATREGMVAFAGHPLLLGSQLLGVMAMFSRAPIDDEALAALASGARLVAVGIKRHAAEQALRISEAFNRSIIDVSLDAVITIDQHGTIEDWNSSAENIFGWTASEVIGKELADTIIPERYRGPHRDGLQRYLATGEGNVINRRIEIQALRKDGSEFPVELTIGAVAGTNGTTFHGLVRDISVRMQIENELRSAAERLQVANAAKDEFLGLVSHELLTPITTIYGNARVLRNNVHLLDAESRAESLCDIETEADRLRRIIENLLVLARFDATEQIETEPLELRGAVEEVVQSFARRQPTRKVLVDVGPDIAFVSVQPTYFDLVLSNLIANADKYSPLERPIEVRCERKGDEVEVLVLDRGTGVLPDEIEELFTPFFRAGRTRADAPGMGVGLAVCKRVLEAQGCRIWATSRDGGGAVFGFALPVENPPVE